MFRLRTFQRIMIRLGNARLPTAASDVLRRRIRFQAMRYDFAMFRFHLRALFFADFRSDLFYLFPIFVTASMFFAIFLIAREGLYFGIFRAREDRRSESSIRRTRRLVFRLIEATRSIHVVLYGTACADRSIRLAALFMAACHARFDSAR